MSQIMSHVEYLAKEIGPRPAGTEEEQQAAFYITEQLQKETGFTASMEDFSSASNVEGGLAALAAVAVVATVLAMIFPVLSIPAFILATAAAVIYGLEAFDKPILSKLLSRGASQNVIAKYQPSGSSDSAARGHSRKIVLIAHYDTGRVTPSIVTRVESSSIPVALVCVCGMIAAAFFLLIRIFVTTGGGMGLLVLNVLSIFAIAICLLPIIRAILVRSAPYNEGATNNATGTVALIEIARRIARGSVSEADLAGEMDFASEGVVIHGEEEARSAGLVPEGAQIQYESEKLVAPSELGERSDEERLLSAKAAIAALTGRPVERRVYGSVADNLVNSAVEDETTSNAEAMAEMMAPVDESGFATAGVSVTGAPARDFSSVPGVSTASGVPASEQAGDAEGFENAPSWFVAAQQNARKAERYNADEAPQVKRSRYTEAIENAERGFSDRVEEARAAERAEREEEARAALAAHAAGQDHASQESVQVEDERGFDDAPHHVDASESVSSEPDSLPVPQSPYGTIAMGAPVPAAEIIAEAQAAALSEVQSEAGPEVQPEPDQHNLISGLPSIDPSNPYNPAPTTNPSRSGILRKLRTDIPSLSGLIAPVSVSPAKAEEVVQPLNDPFEPAFSPSAQDFDPVEVPRSRSGNFLNRFRKNDEEEDLVGTPQEWLNVDESFEARSVGRARGSWESFRDDQYFDGDFDDEFPDRHWEGGAFSRTQLGRVNALPGEEEGLGEPGYDPTNAGEPLSPAAFTGEIERIYHFRNPQFNTEVWFVAMGADGISHDGARAFLEEHASELRGSTIIEIESLGSGVLSVASEEGRIRKVTASSRVKRYTRGAAAATGISVDSVSLAGTDSIASTLQKAGYQTMHLFGAEHGRPALKGSADDVLENVNEHALEEHINFIFELLKG